MFMEKSKEKKIMDVICIGEMVIDFMPVDVDCFRKRAGGAPSNVAIALAKNGIQSGFYGTVGNDGFGDYLFSILKKNNVQILCKKRIDSAITTMTFVTLDDEGNRSFVFARKPGADCFLSKKMIDPLLLGDCKIVHAGSCSLSVAPASKATEYAMKIAKEKKKIVSFDVNYRELLWDKDREKARKKVQNLYPLIDLLKISDEEKDFIEGKREEEVFEFQKTNNISLIVETLGKHGAVCYWNNTLLQEPEFPSNRVDTTGAGDAFWGTFLSTLINEGVEETQDITEIIIKKALKRGNVAGAICIQQKGAVESLPTGSEIDKLIQESQSEQ